MKKFEAPVIEVEKLEVEDVITTSLCTADCTDDVVDCPTDMGLG